MDREADMSNDDVLFDGAPEPGWLCDCGHFQDDDLHCDNCGREPPWGCDCDCHVPEDDDEDWETPPRYRDW